VTVLELLDGSAQVLERGGHAAKIPQLSKLAYLS
jgi:hypothetical protein